MKKVILPLTLVALMSIGLMSCNQCYVCEGASFGAFDGIEYCEKDLGESSLSAAEQSCLAANGTWRES